MPFRMMLIFVLAPHAVASPLAIVGELQPGRSVADIQALLQTTWRLLPVANASASDVAEAVAFVQTPVAQLSGATSGQLYQYDYTGYPVAELQSIPAQFTVANCHQSSIAIAEYVLAGMLQWVVKLPKMDAALRSCTWKEGPPGANCSAAKMMHGQLSDMKLGILGYGNIGEAIAVRAAAFGMRIGATTLNPPQQPPAPLAWIGDDSMNPKLFAESDFVIVCTPLLPTTQGLVNATLLAQMSKRAVLVNIARGPVVQEKPLYDSLASGAIGGAILDVWWNTAPGSDIGPPEGYGVNSHECYRSPSPPNPRRPPAYLPA